MITIIDTRKAQDTQSEEITSFAEFKLVTPVGGGRRERRSRGACVGCTSMVREGFEICSRQRGASMHSAA